MALAWTWSTELNNKKKEGVREGETKGKRKRAGKKGKDRCGESAHTQAVH